MSKPTPQYVVTDDGPLNSPQKKVVPMRENHEINWEPIKELCDADSFGDHFPIFDASRGDNLTAMANHLGDNIQFPKSTAFLHGMGCIAAAMVYNFEVKSKQMDPMPVNMYLLTSQPPSTGKSAINKAFTGAIHKSFEQLNKVRATKRNKAEKEYQDLMKQYEKNDSEQIALELTKAKEKLDSLAHIHYCPTNVTAEALEQIAFNQGGKWSAMTDESGLINTLLGKTYGSGEKSNPNQDIVLQSWDGDFMSSGRITRDGGSGFVRGSLAAIAQDEQLRSMFEAGMRGTGLSERFFIYREPSMLGKRNHKLKGKRMPSDLSAWYHELISVIVNSGPVELCLSDDADDYLDDHKQELEPQLSPGGKYDHGMMTGFIGKMAKHVPKIAAILHVVQHWSDAERPKEISLSTIEWAVEIFQKIVEMYISAIDKQGFAGEETDQECIVKALKSKLAKAGPLAVKNGVRINNRQIRDSVKNLKGFASRQGLGKYLSDKIIPLLKERNILVEIKKGHYIVNPNLAD